MTKEIGRGHCEVKREHIGPGNETQFAARKRAVQEVSVPKLLIGDVTS